MDGAPVEVGAQQGPVRGDDRAPHRQRLARPPLHGVVASGQAHHGVHRAHQAVVVGVGQIAGHAQVGGEPVEEGPGGAVERAGHVELHLRAQLGGGADRLQRLVVGEAAHDQHLAPAAQGRSRTHLEGGGYVTNEQRRASFLLDLIPERLVGHDAGGGAPAHPAMQTARPRPVRCEHGVTVDVDDEGGPGETGVEGHQGGSEAGRALDEHHPGAPAKEEQARSRQLVEVLPGRHPRSPAPGRVDELDGNRQLAGEHAAAGTVTRWSPDQEQGVFPPAHASSRSWSARAL